MAVRFYDEALTAKIQNWVKDPGLRVLKPDESSRLFELHEDTRRDAPIHLPIIALSRDKDIEILNPNKQFKTFNGFMLKGNKKVVMPINVIPIHIGYQLDIYTKGMAEADEYIRNFVFNFVNYPRVRINIPYNEVNIEHESIISLQTTINDNSDIKEHLFPDQFVRFTLKFGIDDAYLFSLPEHEPYTLEDMELHVNDKFDSKIILSQSEIE